MCATLRGFRFRSAWRRLPASPERVYAALETVEDYPRWWPQIREVSGADPNSARVRLRSVLPLEYRITLRSRRRDPRAGLLAVDMDGDLSGWITCEVRAGAAGGSEVHFEQYTDVTRPLLGLLAVVARPLLRANHALMMRAGRRGLCARLRSLDDE
ncbi:SRPBCC family protein [Streptomyces sp. TR06-5]|uniref:SRPBCC family protein n=1 Tax=unclassified Streptomyces TaxID=2593676 RepID=UPI00399FB74A